MSNFWVEASIFCYLPTKQATKLTALKHAILSGQTYSNYRHLIGYIYCTMMPHDATQELSRHWERSNRTPADFLLGRDQYERPPLLWQQHNTSCRRNAYSEVGQTRIHCVCVAHGMITITNGVCTESHDRSCRSMNVLASRWLTAKARRKV